MRLASPPPHYKTNKQMIRLKLKRIARQKGYTVGHLYFDALTDGNKEAWQKICDTLEPQWRDLKNGEEKVWRETAIPEGTYAVAIIWSAKFRRWLPKLLCVPQFEGILIHNGNTPQDTQGCILVGENITKGKVLNSKKNLNNLLAILQRRGKGEGIQITVE